MYLRKMDLVGGPRIENWEEEGVNCTAPGFTRGGGWDIGNMIKIMISTVGDMMNMKKRTNLPTLSTLQQVRNRVKPGSLVTQCVVDQPDLTRPSKETCFYSYLG